MGGGLNLKREKIPFSQQIDYVRDEFEKEGLNGTFLKLPNDPDQLRWQFFYVPSNRKKIRLSVQGHSTAELRSKRKKKEQEAEEKAKRETAHAIVGEKALLKDAIQAWFDNEITGRRLKMGEIRESTCDRYEDTIKRIKQSSLSEKSVYSITVDDIENYLCYLHYEIINDSGERGLSHSSVKKVFGQLRTFFNSWYKQTEEFNKNPMLYVKCPKAKAEGNKRSDIERVKEVLSESELQTLEEICKRDEKTRNGKSYRYDWLLMFLAYTGLRNGEIRALQWKHIKIGDCGENYVIVEQSVRDNVKNRCNKGKDRRKREREITSPKTVNSYRKVHLCKKAVLAITEFKKKCSYTAPDDFVTATTRGDMQVANNTLRDAAISMYKRIGISAERIKSKKMNVHTLRHTAASYFLGKAETEHDKDLIRAMLGHSNIKITEEIYNHTNINDFSFIEKVNLHQREKPKTNNLEGKKTTTQRGMSEQTLKDLNQFLENMRKRK